MIAGPGASEKTMLDIIKSLESAINANQKDTALDLLKELGQGLQAA